MLDAFINYLDKFGPELLVIQFGFLVILSTLFLWLWFSNRRKYHHLKHAIPANVVKNYLDSIIQNSTSLKSQLFRGGGLDVDSVPSVMPLTNLKGGEGLAVSGAPSTALMEELNQKKAQIAALEAQLSTSQAAQREMETKLGHSHTALSAAEQKIKELEALLAQSRSAGGGDAALKAELEMVTKERDEVRDRLKEFEIISDDLANLKRLQQENEQLKRSLAAQGISAPEAATAAAPDPVSQADVSELLSDLGESADAKTSGEAEALEDFLSAPEESVEAPAENAPVEEAASAASPEPQAPEATEEAAPSEAAPEETTAGEEEIAAAMKDENAEGEEKPKPEKTPEDLLSEFEKMLG